MGKIISVSIKLLGEADALRQVQALSLRQGLYKILPPRGYEPSENWEFAPGTIIRISEVDVDGTKQFVARDRNS